MSMGQQWCRLELRCRPDRNRPDIVTKLEIEAVGDPPLSGRIDAMQFLIYTTLRFFRKTRSAFAT